MGEAPARRRDCLDHPSPQEPLVNVYPVVPSAVSSITEEGEVPGGGSLMVAVRLADLVSPAGRPLGEGDRSALVVGGTARIRTGEPVVFCKIVAVAPAQVRRGGVVQAKGSPLHHATLGPLEDWLEEKAGPGVIDGVAALAGDLALVPWSRPWTAASERALGDWRNALGPEPLEELQDIVLRASWREHEDRDWRGVGIGRTRPLKTGSRDGTLVRVPDTPANRAVFGSAGTADDSS